MDLPSATTSVLPTGVPHTEEHYNHFGIGHNHEPPQTPNVSHDSDGLQTRLCGMPGLPMDLLSSRSILVGRIAPHTRVNYDSFQMVPDVQDHEPPYLYTVNTVYTRFGKRFGKRVFRDNKDSVKCLRCGWRGTTWSTFTSHITSRRCPARREKNNAFIQREVFIDSPAPKPGEVQQFTDFQDLPLVEVSEPPYDYIFSARCGQKQFVNEIFRQGTDFVVCYHCHRNYRKCLSLHTHFYTCYNKVYYNPSNGLKIFKRRH